MCRGILLACLLLFGSSFSFSNALFGVDKTNEYRSLHDTPRVSVSRSLSENAQLWADELASSGDFRHSSTSYGENLASLYDNGKSDEEAFNHSVMMWYNEIEFYNYNNPGFSFQTGHFTQLIWKSTIEIGGGIARSNNRIYVVIQYNPSGNIGGLYTRNVLPLSSSNNLPPAPPVSPSSHLPPASPAPPSYPSSHIIPPSYPPQPLQQLSYLLLRINIVDEYNCTDIIENLYLESVRSCKFVHKSTTATYYRVSVAETMFIMKHYVKYIVDMFPCETTIAVQKNVGEKYITSLRVKSNIHC